MMQANGLPRTSRDGSRLADTMRSLCTVVCGHRRTMRGSLARIAQRAIVCFPQLVGLNLIRSWAALRVMSPDGFPIYQESNTHSGAFVATCHSGVTLAAAHALKLAPWIAGGPKPEVLDTFAGDRFLDPNREFNDGH